MRDSRKVPGLVLAALGSTACSHQLPEPAGVSRSGAATATVTAPGAPAAVNREWVKLGYRAAMLNGQTVYCRYEAVTGTQFRTKVCLTGEQLETEVQAARGAADFLNQIHGFDCSGRQGPCRKID